MSTTTTATFVSQKIGKIRWRPQQSNLIKKSSVFCTGSWDDYDNNRVCMWSVGDTEDREEEEEEEWGVDLKGEPSLLCQLPHQDSVTDLLFLTHQLILASSSSGNTCLLKHHVNSQTLSVQAEWRSLHHFASGNPCPCTGVAARSDDSFVSVGEDGSINVVSLEHRTPSRTIEHADSCSISAVCYLKQAEIATVNTSGQLKVWDLREHQGAAQPARLFLPSGERTPLHCVDKHPTQPHIVATGSQDGALCLWDMRQERFPVTMLSAHSAHMWEVKFHPSLPDSLFTCSEDGAVWHWNASNLQSGTPLTGAMAAKDTSRHGDASLSLLNPASSVKASQSQASSPWLACQASKNQLDITDLLPGNQMPINSLDICDTTLLCGSDAEQIISINGLVIT